MFQPEEIERIAAIRKDWEQNELQEFLERQPESKAEPFSASDC